MAAAEPGALHRLRAHQQGVPRDAGEDPQSPRPRPQGHARSVTLLFVLQVSSLTADPSKARYLCQLHLAAGVMTLDTLKKSDEFYTLTGKSAEMDTSGGVRAGAAVA